MALPSRITRLACVVAGAEVAGAGVRVLFTPVRGYPPEIEDYVPLGPAGEITTIRGVGRLLRVLRAGRLRLPPNPYALGEELERAAELVLRCQGTLVDLEVERRVERSLTVWTDSGVDQIRGVIDYTEDDTGLSVSRRGGRSVLKFPRHTLIRFAPASTERLQVVSVEIPTRLRLR